MVATTVNTHAEETTQKHQTIWRRAGERKEQPKPNFPSLLFSVWGEEEDIEFLLSFVCFRSGFKKKTDCREIYIPVGTIKDRGKRQKTNKQANGCV